MDSCFARVKDVIERLRAVLKCQQCCLMREEKLMVFYHICDHFFCIDCIKNEKTCPLCQNPPDKPTNVINDKNILFLYQSLAKFELPSKQDVENIYKTHKKSKEKPKQTNTNEETPKNHSRRLRKNNITTPETGETILLSSSETPKLSVVEFGSGSAKKPTSTRRGKGVVSTPVKKSPAISTPIQKTKQNKTPLTNSAGSLKGNLSKSNINKRNPKGETQLHLACKKSNFQLMADLIAAGANPNAQDNAGWTPLHDSVFSGKMEVIKFLLEHGAKVNAPGLENTTALHEAIAKGNVEMVKLLLEYGADVNAMNIFKETPIDLVVKYQLEDMKDVLSKASTNTKKTSLELAEPDDNFLLYKYNLSVGDEKLVNKFVEKFEGELLSSLTLKSSPSHIIIPHEKVEMSWTLISSVPKGCWVVTPDWVKDSLTDSTPKPASSYEPSTPLFSGFSKARTNKLNQLPGLFSGCHFFFGGSFEHYTVKNITIGKEDLKNLVEANGGLIVKRCPDPESLALEKTVPFHATPTSSLEETSYFIIYQTEKYDPRPKYNMSHMKTLPVEWLVCCILRFELLNPNDKSWTGFL